MSSRQLWPYFLPIIAYNNAEDYLNTQFRLLRKDLVSGLQKGIARIREEQASGPSDASANRRQSDVKALYKNLKIVSTRLSQNGVNFLVL